MNRTEKLNKQRVLWEESIGFLRALNKVSLGITNSLDSEGSNESEEPHKEKESSERDEDDTRKLFQITGESKSSSFKSDNLRRRISEETLRSLKQEQVRLLIQTLPLIDLQSDYMKITLDKINSLL